MSFARIRRLPLRVGALAGATLGLVAISTAPTAAASAPTVALGPYVPSAQTAVGLVGYVNPNGESTSYYFQYGNTDCSGGGCTSVPANQEAQVGGGTSPVRVSAELTGLHPGTSYHVRLVAENAAGTGASDDTTFRTLDSTVEERAGGCPNEALREAQGTTDLPECRAYELVSRFPSLGRNSADIVFSTERVQAAADGDALTFISTGGIDGAEAVPGAAEYLSARGTDGWNPHGITPPQKPTTLNEMVLAPIGYKGDLSPDLSTGVFLSNAQLGAEGPNVAETMNLYLRDDLLSPGAGEYTLLTDSYVPQPADLEMTPRLAAASADFSHVLFESPRDLVQGAAGLGEGIKLYEWVAGAGERLVGILPEAEGGGPTLAEAGRGATERYFTARSMSRDGSRVVFTTPLSGGSYTEGNLYLRDDKGTLSTADDTTVRLNASEKSNGGGLGGGDPAGPQPATFWDATPDLSQVFFTSSEALTDSAPTDEPDVPKLYRYEPGAPEGHRLTLISLDEEPADGTSDAADGAIGVSDDGSFVYFAGPNQLQPGGPTDSSERIFVWHEGEIRDVAGINPGIELRRILGANPWLSFGGASAKWSRLTADGRHLTFVSEGTGELTGYDHGNACPNFEGTDGCTEIYAYEASATGGPGRLQCASCDPTGTPATHDADFFFFPPSLLVGNNSYLNRAQSASGRLVAFTSNERLAPDDRNGHPDAYVFDTVTGEVRLLSDGGEATDSRFMDASSDGSDIFFVTRARLLPSDSNENTDMYDARVDGGFEEPMVEAPICASTDACRPVGAAGEPTVPATESPTAHRRPRRRRAHRHRRHNVHRHHRHRRRQDRRHRSGKAGTRG